MPPRDFEKAFVAIFLNPFMWSGGNTYTDSISIFGNAHVKFLLVSWALNDDCQNVGRDSSLM